MEVLYACDCSPVVDVHSAGYAYIRQCVREVFPEAGIVPYVMLGGTDAKHYAKVCDCALRFAPTVLTPQQLASMPRAATKTCRWTRWRGRWRFTGGC